LLAVTVLGASGCASLWNDDLSGVDFRAEMRQLVQEIADYARSSAPGFVVIPQNGHELITLDGAANGQLAEEYVAAITGMGREDLFYGYENDDEPTPPEETSRISAVLDRAVDEGVAVLVTDYCATAAYVDDSYSRSAARGYISFAADSRELDRIPAYPPGGYATHAGAVTTLSEAVNFLYLINPGEFESSGAFVSALDATEYDVLIIDAFHDGDQALTADQVATLQSKPGGAARLVIAYMSIGEAEDYRYYWQDEWRPGSPEWLERQNALWRGNYKVRYWYDEWKAVILGNESAYLDRLLAAGFDGVYLDIVDGYEYFEEEYL
jgi:cysteinyl-tRNA synthetase